MSYTIEGKTGQWELVIGLEVHCQIISKSKLFSGSSTAFGSQPNANVSFIDAGLPGVLPSPNKFCIEQALKTGLALNSDINLISYFDRKHYFYPDLPFGYQITQFFEPIAENGSLRIDLEDGSSKSIVIERLHIEQDAGKLLHEHHPSKSFVDLNRAGVGLMEIVSGPDLRSKEEVAVYISNLRSIVRFLGTCDGNMDEGSMRCDINISVRKPNEPYRTRVEVKNVNSIKFIQQAIDYEANLQVQIWEEGKTVEQETKLFNSATGKTYSLRAKVDAGDYRYMRDPDLLPVVLEQAYVDKIASTLPELPQSKTDRYMQSYGFNSYDCSVLMADRAYCEFFEQTLDEGNHNRNPKTVLNVITSQLFYYLNRDNLEIRESPITPSMIAELVDLIEDNTISTKIAKDIFDIMWGEPKSPSIIVEEKGLKQITNTAQLEALVASLVNDNQDKIEQIRAGKDRLLGWFVGEVMKQTKGKANPELVNSLLNKKINK